jgi:hypothetical protein
MSTKVTKISLAIGRLKERSFIMARNCHVRRRENLKTPTKDRADLEHDV